MNLEKLIFFIDKNNIIVLVTYKGYKISILKQNAYNIFSKVWQLEHFWILIYEIPICFNSRDLTC